MFRKQAILVATVATLAPLATGAQMRGQPQAARQDTAAVTELSSGQPGRWYFAAHGGK